jgi:hypothetical protein
VTPGFEDIGVSIASPHPAYTLDAVMLTLLFTWPTTASTAGSWQSAAAPAWPFASLASSSKTAASSRAPSTPPAPFCSSMASSTAFFISTPKVAAPPVSGVPIPIRITCPWSCAVAGPLHAASRPASRNATVRIRRAMVGPPL